MGFAVNAIRCSYIIAKHSTQTNNGPVDAMRLIEDEMGIEIHTRLSFFRWSLINRPQVWIYLTLRWKLVAPISGSDLLRGKLSNCQPRRLA